MYEVIFEGIRLDKESIKPNAAKRGLAKLCLNSMWGKLTERKDRVQTKVISAPKELYSFLAIRGIGVTNLTLASDNVVWITWKQAAEEYVPNLRHTNEVIGAFVTPSARIHLFRYLDRLGQNTIFCYTDSLIYMLPRDETGLIETGNKLGDMTSELRPAIYVSELVSGEPKNYAYRTIDTVNGRSDTYCKVRRKTQN